MTDQGDSAPGDSAPGGFDIGSLLSQLGQVQENLQQAQQHAASEVVEGSSGGGAVKVSVSGAMEFLSVTIDPSVVDPADVDMLEDLVLAAIRDGVEQASGLASQAIQGAALPGLGQGGLGGLLGGLLGGPPDE
jgi:DNA-binding YbaB/EbfC family protein